MSTIHLLCTYLLISLLTVSVVFAQEDKAVFGKVSLEDLQLKYYDRDTTAAAVILYERGYTHYAARRGSIKLVTERHVRIKLFSMKGYDPRSFAIPYYASGSNPDQKEAITLLQGYTHVLRQGKAERYKLSGKDMFTDAGDPEWKARRFRMPGVEAGAILEYRYTIESDFLTHIEGWNFQRELPVRWSQFDLAIPDEYFDFDVIPQGNPSFAKVPQKSVLNEIAGANATFGLTTRQRWVMKHVPAFRELPMMGSPSQCAPRITVRLKSFYFPWTDRITEIPYTWPEINRYLLEHPQFKEVSAGQTTLPELDQIVHNTTASLTDPLQKMIALYDYVKNTIQWNGQMSKFMTSDVKRTLREKTGNTADLNMLLLVLLRRAGLSADPVIVRTRDQGRIIEAYLSIDQFNTIVIYTRANGQVYLLDACNPLRPYDLLPVYALGEKNWRVSALYEGMTKTESVAKSALALNAVLSVDAQGQISGSLQSKASGQYALQGREMSRYDSRERYVQQCWQTAGTGVGLSSISIEGLDDLAVPLKAECSIATDRLATVSGEEISFNPLLTRAVPANIFTDSTRNCDVDFGFPLEETYRLSLTLPAGYEIARQPANFSKTMADGAAVFTYAISVSGQVMQVLVKLEIVKDRIEPEQYGALRSFFADMAAKHAEKVVLRKVR